MADKKYYSFRFPDQDQLQVDLIACEIAKLIESYINFDGFKITDGQSHVIATEINKRYFVFKKGR